MKKLITSLASIILISLSCFATDLSAIRLMYSGTPIALSAGTIITGVVISDRSGFNTPSQSVMIQDGTGGICLRADFIHTLNLNDSISIDVSGDTLTEFNGLLQVSHALLDSVTFHGTGSITPRIVTIDEILSNMNGTADTWESTLVKIISVTITNDSTGVYGGSDTLTDATASMITFTRSQATFASATLPVGAVNLTGYITDFIIPEVIIRNLYDVQVNPSVGEVDSNNRLVIYPNPAQDHFTITASEITMRIEVNISDLTGKIIYTGYSSGNEPLTVSTEKFAEGIYFVRFSAKDFSATKKLVIVNQ